MHAQWEAWQRDGLEIMETPSVEQAVLDYLLVAVRHMGGIDLALLAKRWGASLAAPVIQEMKAQKLITRDGHRLIPTEDGWAVADGLTLKFAESITFL